MCWKETRNVDPCANAFERDLKMSVFAFTPLVLAGVVALGSHILARSLTSDAATAILKRARAAASVCRRGFSKNTDADKVRFEIDVLKSMFANVPDDSKVAVEREIDTLTREFERQMKSFYSRKFSSEAESIGRALSGLRIGNVIAAPELADIQARAGVLQQDLAHMRIEERNAAASKLVHIFERIEDVEQVRKDLDSVNDIDSSLGVHNSEHDRARKSGMLSHIIQRLHSSQFATASDVHKAKAVANRVLAQPALDGPMGTSDVQRLKSVLSVRVLSENELKNAKELLRRIPQHETSHVTLQRGVGEHERLIQRLKPYVLDEQTYASALNTARSIAADLKLQTRAQEQASHLLAYVQLIRSQCRRLSNPVDKEREVDAIINTLHGLGAIASPTTPNDRRANNPSSTESQIAGIRSKISSYDFLHEVDQMLVDLQLGVDNLDPAQKQDLVHSHAELVRQLQEAKVAKTNDRRSKWLLAVATKHFQSNGNLKRSSGIDRKRLKRELDNMKVTGNLAGGQHGRVDTLLSKLR